MTSGGRRVGTTPRSSSRTARTCKGLRATPPSDHRRHRRRPLQGPAAGSARSTRLIKVRETSRPILIIPLNHTERSVISIAGGGRCLPPQQPLLAVVGFCCKAAPATVQRLCAPPAAWRCLAGAPFAVAQSRLSAAVSKGTTGCPSCVSDRCGLPPRGMLPSGDRSNPRTNAAASPFFRLERNCGSKPHTVRDEPSSYAAPDQIMGFGLDARLVSPPTATTLRDHRPVGRGGMESRRLNPACAGRRRPQRGRLVDRDGRPFLAPFTTTRNAGPTKTVPR